MRITPVTLPSNGNTGVVPPWLQYPQPSTPPEPTPTRPWWLDGDWDEPHTGYTYNAHALALRG